MAKAILGEVMIFGKTSSRDAAGLIGACLVIFLAQSCGTEFIDRAKSRSIKYDPALGTGDQTANKPLPSDLINPDDDHPSLSARWSLTCDPLANAFAQTHDYEFEGTGDHSLDMAPGQELLLSLSAAPCELARELPREVIFIVDTSGSMRQNDPQANNTCGRLDAITKMLSASVGTDTRFAIVTFGSEVEDASQGFFQSQKNLFDDLAATSNNGSLAEEVLCRNGGSTNYRDAFARAANLFTQSARGGSQLEAYVISDGEPDRNREGLAIADDLKQRGIVIGTVMLAGDDRVLEQQIASRDSGNKPFHVKVNMAQDLAQAIESLAKGFEKTGGTLSYRLDPADPWTDVTVANSNPSNIGPLAIIKDPARQQKIELNFKYIDASGPVIQAGSLLLP